jgi:hypothetical protein
MGTIMKCDDMQERLVELLYEEEGGASAGTEVAEHLRLCPGCRKELEDLRAVRAKLGLWEDEKPLRPVAVPRARAGRAFFAAPLWRAVRYAAVAALVALALLGLSNAQITWDRNGFSFRAGILPAQRPAAEYLTREEVRDALQQLRLISQDDAYLMIQKMLDVQDQRLRALTLQIRQDGGRN